jgi:hypothetical protein
MMDVVGFLLLFWFLPLEYVLDHECRVTRVRRAVADFFPGRQALRGVPHVFDKGGNVLAMRTWSCCKMADPTRVRRGALQICNDCVPCDLHTAWW